NPAGTTVGRYLTRHRNAVVFGMYPRQPNGQRVFDKQVAILDFYRGGGSIQQMSPPLGLIHAFVPWFLRMPATLLLSRASGLVAIAEDQPRWENGVSVDWRRTNSYGLPTLRVQHTHSMRDERVAGGLIHHAKRILREAGARLTRVHKIETFTHALGT